jgi:hypothetical protein
MKKKKYVLLPSQKNQVFDMIEQTELNPANFEWSETQSKYIENLWVPKITYAGSEFFYLFDSLGGNTLAATYSPGEEKLIDETGNLSGWALQRTYVSNWLYYLRREIGRPNLWAEIAKYKFHPASEIVTNISNEPFTFQQVEQILFALKQVKTYIEQQKIASEEQMRFVNEKLDYLAEAVKRQGRKDWIYTCIGAMVTIATALTLTAEHSKVIWSLIQNAIIGVIKFLPK